uniref:Ubiq_cyt_C_chap domain-containing protein n=2 Tax=Macrostomum lignano TaxID=282301 RepID=A0A1I8H8N5_9PLAT
YPQSAPRIFLQPRLAAAAAPAYLIGCRRGLASKPKTKVYQALPFTQLVKKQLLNLRCVVGWRRDPYLKVAKSLYCVCAEYPDHSGEWIARLGLDDSFATWHGVTSLHLWLVMQRLRAICEQTVSKGSVDIDYPTTYVLYGMGRLFHADIRQRLHDFPTVSMKIRTAGQLFNQFQHVNFLYKLAYIDTDMALAEVLWKQVCHGSPNVDAEGLNLLVRYVRANYRHLSTVPNSDLVDNGIATFLPLVPKPSRDETKAWMRQRLKHALAPQSTVQRAGQQQGGS